MNYTENHALPQWEKTDRIQMEDFNNAMAVIDTSLPKIAIGSYSGNDLSPRTITLPFTPKAVIVTNQSGQMGDYKGNTLLYYGGFAVTDSNAAAVSIVENGFNVYSDYGAKYSNYSGMKFHYIAIG